MNGPGHSTGIRKAIWLHICREGGLWTPDEIAAEFNLSRQKASLAMHNMAGTSGMLHRYKAGRRTSFGVTVTCKVPLSVSLDELAEAGAIRTEEAKLVCYEAYQVVGSLLSDLGKFDADEAQKVLDNLSQARLVHGDVLPWPSYARESA